MGLIRIMHASIQMTHTSQIMLVQHIHKLESKNEVSNGSEEEGSEKVSH